MHAVLVNAHIRDGVVIGDQEMKAEVRTDSTLRQAIWQLDDGGRDIGRREGGMNSVIRGHIRQIDCHCRGIGELHGNIVYSHHGYHEAEIRGDTKRRRCPIKDSNIARRLNRTPRASRGSNGVC